MLSPFVARPSRRAGWTLRGRGGARRPPRAGGGGVPPPAAARRPGRGSCSLHSGPAEGGGGAGRGGGGGEASARGGEAEGEGARRYAERLRGECGGEVLPG